MRRRQLYAIRYERRSQTQARLLSRLYLEGLSTGDFEPTFRALVGGTAALSAQSILRLKEEWKQEYDIGARSRRAGAKVSVVPIREVDR